MGILMETTEVNLGTARTSYRGRRRVEPELFGAMGTPRDFFAETIHTIAINTTETDFGSIVEPIPITLKTYKRFQAYGHSINGVHPVNGVHPINGAYPINCVHPINGAQPINGFGYPQQMVTALTAAPRIPEIERPSTSSHTPNPVKQEAKDAQKVTRAPPKKKWIKEYLEEEPKSPVSVRVVTGLPVTPRSNGVVRPASPVLPAAPPPAPPAAVTDPPPAAASALLLDFVQEHSRPRTTSNSHGPPQIPSPPSVGSNGSGSSGSGSAPRAGTREVHNKLEKNRRAHLKECFELLKRQLPATQDDKKTSNLSILGSAIRYIQVLRRKERECEHEMERLAREKIAAQQRLAALKREVPPRPTLRPRSIDAVSEERDRDDSVSGQVLGIPISITSSPPRTVTRMEASSPPPRTLNLSTKLRTLPIQITPTTSQVVRTSYGARHNTLTLTTLAPADASNQNGQALDGGVTSTLSTTLVHPAQIHLPLSQVVGTGGLVVGPAALQLLSAGGVRVLQAPTVHANGLAIGENNRIPKENGIVSPPPASTGGSVVVSGLTPLVVSQPAAHLLHTHTLAHKMVETQVVKGSMTPLTVSAQYLSATTIVKPVVVVSGAHTPPAPPT